MPASNLRTIQAAPFWKKLCTLATDSEMLQWIGCMTTCIEITEFHFLSTVHMMDWVKFQDFIVCVCAVISISLIYCEVIMLSCSHIFQFIDLCTLLYLWTIITEDWLKFPIFTEKVNTNVENTHSKQNKIS